MEALAAAEPQLIIDIGEKKDGMKEDLDSIQEQYTRTNRNPYYICGSNNC